MERFHIMIWRCYDLYYPRTIAKIDKNKSAMITTTFNPTAQYVNCGKQL